MRLAMFNISLKNIINKVEVKILGGGYFNPSLCNLLTLEIICLLWQYRGYSAGILYSLVTYNGVYSRCRLSKGHTKTQQSYQNFPRPRDFLDRAIFGPTLDFEVLFIGLVLP
jgi:hypothetical protein